MFDAEFDNTTAAGHSTLQSIHRMLDADMPVLLGARAACFLAPFSPNTRQNRNDSSAAADTTVVPSGL
jgi:hypothetical protein